MPPKHRSRAPRSRRPHSREFTCRICLPPESGECPVLGLPDVIRHFRESHPELLEDGKLRGRKSLQMALDGEDFYRNSYLWSQDEKVILEEVTSGPRKSRW